MIKISKEMNDLRKNRIEEVEKRIDSHILKAVERRENSCYFACDKDTDKDIYDEIRAKYEAEGYHIKPTGYIGGVWQLAEDICW